MKITEFKSGLFGYKKEGVYRYIATLNERYSETLNAATRQNESKIKELTAQNAALQEEVAALRAALLGCKTGCMAMIEAVSAVCGDFSDDLAASSSDTETMQDTEPDACEGETTVQSSEKVTEQHHENSSAESNLSVFRRKNKA